MSNSNTRFQLEELNRQYINELSIIDKIHPNNHKRWGGNPQNSLAREKAYARYLQKVKEIHNDTNNPDKKN